MNSRSDIVITSGAVAAGKFDFIPKIINKFKLKSIELFLLILIIYSYKIINIKRIEKNKYNSSVSKQNIK